MLLQPGIGAGGARMPPLSRQRWSVGALPRIAAAAECSQAQGMAEIDLQQRLTFRCGVSGDPGGPEQEVALPAGDLRSKLVAYVREGVSRAKPTDWRHRGPPRPGQHPSRPRPIV